MTSDRVSDLVVVGSGVAGLSAALAAAERGARVQLLTAGPLLAGSSARAQGGVAAAVGADDATSLHVADTMAVGAGLNDRPAVSVLVAEGQRIARRLLDEGVPFEGGPDDPDLGLEAGHSRRRILHAGGAATGRALTSNLLARAVEHLNITVQTNAPASALLVEADRVVGVRSGELVYRAPAVVLTTGGYAALWGRTTNAPESRGTGAALAWAAGASLADLELVQFHPTALNLPGESAFLLSEALRGEGALVVDAQERPILDPLQPRDVVARGIARYLRDHGPVFLTLRHLDPHEVRERFSSLTAYLDERGLDIARDLLPIAPASHYCMGGVRTDAWGRTDVVGLYAAGEVACTGVQGANRLASNSLLECLVFGERAALAALENPSLAAEWTTEPLPENADLDLTGASRLEPALLADSAALGARLDRDLGVERDAPRLTALLQALPDPDATDTPGDVRMAGFATRAALLRQESRGAHFRSDAPETRDAWRGRIHWRRDAAPRFEEVSL
jgi:L-aspartate oxidase